MKNFDKIKRYDDWAHRDFDGETTDTAPCPTGRFLDRLDVKNYLTNFRLRWLVNGAIFSTAIDSALAGNFLFALIGVVLIYWNSTYD